MIVTTYSKTGIKATSPAKLNKGVFGVEVKNHELLKQAYVMYLANGRQNSARTKTRGEVRGGGKKPWRQKGTGRARFGSSRVPIWRGGGITFGPTGEENYTKKLPQKAKQTALRQALSLVAQDGRLVIIEAFESKDGKVKPTLTLLDKIGAQNKVLLVTDKKDELLKRATRNLAKVAVVQADYLNVYDLLNADSIVMSKKALDIVHAWLGNETGIKGAAV